MQNQKTTFSKNRIRSASEWIQASVTLAVLLIIYASRGYLGSSFTPSEPVTPPLTVDQKSYWNDELGYGFRADHQDAYASWSQSDRDRVAVDKKEGVIFEDAQVRVSYYPDTPLQEIEKRHVSNEPRAYSELSHGIAVIEWDLASNSAKMVLATLHSR